MGAPDQQHAVRIAYLGPAGTFTEEALLSVPELAEGELVAINGLADVLSAVASGDADLAFVPLENSIEGSVHATLDSMIFEHDLLIQREVVLDIHLHLMAHPGTRLADVRRVLSMPVALAQCRGWLAEQLPGADVVAATSTAEAARVIGEGSDPGDAAIAPAVAAKLYGLDVVASEVEDHSGNQTRFVALARDGIPGATGHDRTSIVCFQRSDRPGSLLAILEQFAARSINLTRIESRPTKRQLGQYCFLIELEGHLEDEMVADCLRNLHTELGAVKFLGSYPAAGSDGSRRRRQAADAWHAADVWVATLRDRIVR